MRIFRRFALLSCLVAALIVTLKNTNSNESSPARLAPLASLNPTARPEVPKINESGLLPSQTVGLPDQVASQDIPIALSQLSLFYAALPMSGCRHKPDLSVFQAWVAGVNQSVGREPIQAKLESVIVPTYHDYQTTVILSGLTYPFEIHKSYAKPVSVEQGLASSENIFPGQIETRLKTLAKLATKFQIATSRPPIGTELLALELVNNEQGDEGVLQLLAKAPIVIENMGRAGLMAWATRTVQHIFDENSTEDTNVPRENYAAHTPLEQLTPLLQAKTPKEVLNYTLAHSSEATFWPESMAAALLTVMRGGQWSNEDYTTILNGLYIDPANRDLEFLKAKRLMEATEKLTEGTALAKACFNSFPGA